MFDSNHIKTDERNGLAEQPDGEVALSKGVDNSASFCMKADNQPGLSEELGNRDGYVKGIVLDGRVTNELLEIKRTSKTKSINRKTNMQTGMLYR